MMPRTRVKFCGIMRPEDAELAADAGADAIGMILHANARRLIDLPTAKKIVAAVPPLVSPVGVFVDAPADVIRRYTTDLQLAHAQLHGDETPTFAAGLADVRVVKVFKMQAGIDVELHDWAAYYRRGELPNLVGLLIDSPGGGGTGQTNDFDALKKLLLNDDFCILPPVTIAGGLNPTNVSAVVNALRPYAVDTSSGIEAEFGKKSPEMMRAFYDAVAKACL